MFDLKNSTDIFMKRISIILVGMVYMLPGVLAVLNHTHAIEAFKAETPQVTESQFAAADTTVVQDGKYLVMLEPVVKK